MRVFLGNPPWQGRGWYGVRAGSRWPHREKKGTEYMPFPFFLAQAAALLEEDSHDVVLVDGIAERIDEKAFIGRVSTHKPDVVVLEISTPSIEADLKLLRNMRIALGTSPALVLCGVHSAMYQPEFLDQCRDADVVLVGEYEETVQDLVRAIENGDGVGQVAGILYRSPDGTVSQTSRRPLIDPLERLPWSARHLLPMDKYRDEPGNIARPSVQMWASRGCPFTCSYCAWPQIIYGGNSYRTRDIIDVVDEMEWLVRSCGFRSVYFDDDTFNVGRQRMLRFADEVRSRRLDVPWAIMARADLMDGDLLDAMQKAGLYAVKYGVESADQALLDLCGKRMNLSKALRMIRLTRDMGIKTHLTFMFGLPGETWDTARRTIDLACDLNPESVQFSLATPFPGSQFHKEMETEGCLEASVGNAYDGGTRAVVRTHTMSPDDLEVCLKDAWREWQDHIQKRAKAIPRADVSKRNRVSVIVPTFGNSELVGHCLESVAQQTVSPCDVVVVNDGAVADDVGRACAGIEGIRYIDNRENRGFAAAANQGIEECAGDYILLLNSDVEIDESCLEVLQAALDSDPAVGFVAPRVLRHDNHGIVDSAGHAMTRSGYTFNIGAGAPSSQVLDVQQDVMGAPGSVAMYRRSMLTEVGLFDVDLVWYLEDLDLSFRAQLWGYRCLYVPTATARHRGQASTGSFYSSEKVFRTARNTVAVLLKNMPRRLFFRHLYRIAAFLFLQQCYHMIRTGQGAAYARGLCSGMRTARLWVSKRKRILGGRRIDDDAVERLLRESERYLDISCTRWR